jgi:hypothetical protein
MERRAKWQVIEYCCSRKGRPSSVIRATPMKERREPYAEDTQSKGQEDLTSFYQEKRMGYIIYRTLVCHFLFLF